MNFQIVKTIYRKEMLDMLRDRRALISMIVVPIIAMPGLFSILHYFTENLEKRRRRSRFESAFHRTCQRRASAMP